MLADTMHCGALGVHLIMGGSCLYELCISHHVGRFEETQWHLALDLQLASAWRSFRRSCKDKSIRLSVPMIKTTKLSVTTEERRPVLRYKAYTALVVVDWLASACVE